MSETPPEPKAKKPARPLNRWGTGTLSLLQIIFLAILLLALNYLSAKYHRQLDLSREGKYTLSARTTSYLGGKDLKDRAKPVKWIMAFRRSSPFYENVRALADEYSRLSGDKIQLEVVDPLRSSDRTQEVTATYGLPLTKDLIIMDARLDDSLVSNQDKQGNRILNPNVKIVVADDLAVFTTDTESKRKISGSRIEDVLTGRLREAIQGRARLMYFLADKSRLDAEGENSPLKALSETLLFQNVELRGLSLAGADKIPDDAEGVALVAPRYDLTDAELAVLEKYWNKPRAAMLVLLSAGETPPKLRMFLRANGVTPRKDRIIAKGKDSLITTARGMFTPGIDFTKDFSLLGTSFEGATSSMEVREAAEDLLNHQIYPMALIQADEGYWGETKFGEKNVAFDEKEDNKGPLFMAAAVTRGAAGNDKFAEDTSRMIVISNTDFLDPSRKRAENMDFLAASVNWIVNRQVLAGIGPRPFGIFRLPLLDAQVSFINRVNLFFLPVFLLMAGAMVWSSRRA